MIQTHAPSLTSNTVAPRTKPRTHELWGDIFSPSHNATTTWGMQVTFLEGTSDSSQGRKRQGGQPEEEGVPGCGGTLSPVQHMGTHAATLCPVQHMGAMVLGALYLPHIESVSMHRTC